MLCFGITEDDDPVLQSPHEAFGCIIITPACAAFPGCPEGFNGMKMEEHRHLILSKRVRSQHSSGTTSRIRSRCSISM